MFCPFSRLLFSIKTYFMQTNSILYLETYNQNIFFFFKCCPTTLACQILSLDFYDVRSHLLALAKLINRRVTRASEEETWWISLWKCTVVIGPSLATRLNHRPQSITISRQNKSQREWGAPATPHPNPLLFSSLLKNAPRDRCLSWRWTSDLGVVESAAGCDYLYCLFPSDRVWKGTCKRILLFRRHQWGCRRIYQKHETHLAALPSLLGGKTSRCQIQRK